MQQLLKSVPGSVWLVIITALTLVAEWLSRYFGAPWVAPVAGFLVAVLVPVIKLLAVDPAQDRGIIPSAFECGRANLSRWLWG